MKGQGKLYLIVCDEQQASTAALLFTFGSFRDIGNPMDRELGNSVWSVLETLPRVQNKVYQVYTT